MGDYEEGDENPMHHLRVIFGGGGPQPDQFIFSQDLAPGAAPDEDEDDAEPRNHAGVAAARALHLFEHYDTLMQMRHPGHSITLNSPHSLGMRLGAGGAQANASAAHPLLQRQTASAPSAPTVHTRVVGRIEGRHLPNHPRGLRLSRGDGAGPEFRLSFMEAQDLNFISGHNRQAPQRRWNEVSGNSVNASTIEDALLHMLTVNEQGSEAEGAQEGIRLPHSRANDGFEQYLERVNSRAQERNGMPFSPFPLPASLR